MIRYLTARLAIWLGQQRCRHHWHAADAMIRIVCCWCGKDDDGWPVNRTEQCAFWIEEVA